MSLSFPYVYLILIVDRFQYQFRLFYTRNLFIYRLVLFFWIMRADRSKPGRDSQTLVHAFGIKLRVSVFGSYGHAYGSVILYSGYIVPCHGGCMYGSLGRTSIIVSSPVAKPYVPGRIGISRFQICGGLPSTDRSIGLVFVPRTRSSMSTSNIAINKNANFH